MARLGARNRASLDCLELLLVNLKAQSKTPFSLYLKEEEHSFPDFQESSQKGPIFGETRHRTPSMDTKASIKPGHLALEVSAAG